MKKNTRKTAPSKPVTLASQRSELRQEQVQSWVTAVKIIAGALLIGAVEWIVFTIP
jgi:hypothetical protein